MNEFELIARLTAALPTNDAVVSGAGDDCAVLDLGVPDKLVRIAQQLFETFGRDDTAPKELLTHLAADARRQHGILCYEQVDIRYFGGFRRYERHSKNLV